MGRKCVYEEKVKPRLTEISKWYELLTEGQIAKKLGIHQATFEKYKNDYPELREALKRGRESLVEELKDNLKKKAQGFYYTERKTVIRKIGEKESRLVEEYSRYSAPDVGAIHLLLKNLDDTWRNDDKETMDLKREKLELEKQKAESEW